MCVRVSYARRRTLADQRYDTAGVQLFPEYLQLDPAQSRIPTCRVESWQAFQTFASNGELEPVGADFVFRGQRRADWGLSPSIARLDPNYLINKDTAERQIGQFRRAVRGRLSDYALVELDNEDELWSVGQHHGLFTPILDWSASPYVALYFAFAEEDPKGEEPNPFRAIYGINRSFISDLADEQAPVRIYEPKRDDMVGWSIKPDSSPSVPTVTLSKTCSSRRSIPCSPISLRTKNTSPSPGSCSRS